MTKKKPIIPTFKVVGIHWQADDKYMIFTLVIPALPQLRPAQKTMKVFPPTIRSFS